MSLDEKTPSYTLTGRLIGAQESVKGKITGIPDMIKGYSAYEVAVINGFKGTEQEWLASLKGEKGDKGDAVKGDPGYTPQKGIDYFDGKDGYTPQKGVDYFDGEDGYTPQKGIDYFDGKDGASITVQSVSESAADGGSNVVTFSDGKKVTIKNGNKGNPGYTPQKGVDYFDGKDGEDGAEIVSFVRTSGNGQPGTTDIYTMTLSDGRTINVPIYNGADGEGSGDMLASVYDPKGKRQDVFAYADTQASAAEAAALAAIPTQTSQLTNDSGYITGFTESDPTVPSWAKAPTKPTYTASEVGARPDTWMPTAADIGAVSLSGGTMTGTLYATDGISLTANVSSANNDQGVTLNNGEYTACLSLGASGGFGIYSDNTLFIRPGMSEGSGYGVKMTSSDMSPTTNASLSLGTSSSMQYNKIYGKTIYQNGKQVANKEDIPALSTETWTFTLEDGSTVTKAVYVG